MRLKKTYRNILDSIKRTFRIGSYWYWIEGDQLDNDIEIEPLVYPFRYDILIRKGFFELYESKREFYKLNFDDLVDAALDSDYFVWFKNVVITRYYPELKSDEVAIKKAFSERVKQSADLYEGIKSFGFDIECPIIPYTAEEIVSISSNKEEQKYFMGDGCHRLACLMSMGYTSIPKQYVRVKCFNRRSPYDNTSILRPYVAEIESWLLNKN